MDEEAVQVEGVALVTKRMYTVRGETALGVERGLVKAGIAGQRKSQRVVPVDTWRLYTSAFTAKEGSGFSTRVTVGYTAPYALFVHEDLEARHAPGKQAKYLTQPLEQAQEELREIVREEAQLGARGSVPQAVAPASLAAHALLPVMPRGPGSYVERVGGDKVTYVRGSGWRRGAEA